MPHHDDSILLILSYSDESPLAGEKGMCHNYHNPLEATPHRGSKSHACYPPPVSGSMLV